MEIGLGIALNHLWSGTSTLWQYNQGLWQWDKDQRQNRVYQAQGMAISQVGLWREDLGDLFDLTATKMDNFANVSTLVFGFAIGLLIDYFVNPQVPAWLFLLGVSMCSVCFVFSIISMYFSMYAAFVVQQIKTKVMTEVVRLPIADAEAITAGSALGRTYENPRNARMMLRLPVLGSNSQAHTHSDTTKQTMAPFSSASPHMPMFEQLQSQWMPLANFARVAMLSSLTAMTYTVIYMSLGQHLAVARHIGASIAFTIILTAVNLKVQTIDFMLTKRDWTYNVVIHVVPPIWSMIMVIMSMLHDERWGRFGAPIVFLCHVCWLLFLLGAAAPATDVRDSKFRLTVLQNVQWGRRVKKDQPESKSLLSDVGDTAAEAPVREGLRQRGSSMGEAPKVESAAKDSFTGSFQSSQTAATTDTESQQRLREEVQHYHRTAASLIVELQQYGSYIHYVEEFKSLSRLADEPEDLNFIPNSRKSFAQVTADNLMKANSVGLMQEDRREIASVNPHHVVTTALPHGLSMGDGVVYFKGSGQALNVGGSAVSDGTLFYIRSVGADRFTLHDALTDELEHDKSMVLIEEGSGIGAQLRKAPLNCAAGHPLREKHGQTVFHLTNRFCAICEKDLERKETRYTCDTCTKYDVCVACAKAIQRSVFPPGGNTLGGSVLSTESTAGPSPKKTERRVKAALADLRERVSKLDDEKGRRPKRDFKGHKIGQSRPEMEPLENDLRMLPTPINENRLEEAMNARATRDIGNLPWDIYRTMTTVMILAFFLCFCWSIVQAATPNLNVGRAGDSWKLTPRDEYLDLAGDEEPTGGRHSPERLLSGDDPFSALGLVSVPALQATSEPQAVALWLSARGYNAAAKRAEALGVDGITLQNLDRTGWSVLGITSGVERAKLEVAANADLGQTLAPALRLPQERLPDRQSPGVSVSRPKAEFRPVI